MAVKEAANKNRLDDTVMIRQYQGALTTRDGTIFDSIDLPFDCSEFTFFYRLLHFVDRDNTSKEREALYEAAFLSTLVYLSSKIHFSISEHIDSEKQLRGELQFPILAGDLLYGCFFAEIIKGSFITHLEKYTDYLARFNADMIAYLRQEEPLDEFLPNQLADLAQLTVYVYDNNASEGNYRLAEQLGKVEGALLMGKMPSPSLLDGIGREDEAAELLRQLQKDSVQGVVSFQDLANYLSTN